MTTVYAPTTHSQHDTSTIEGRFAACCDWFGLEVPHFTYRPDNTEAVLLTNDLLDWGFASGVSLNWLFFGDPRGVVTAFRMTEGREHQFRL